MAYPRVKETQVPVGKDLSKEFLGAKPADQAAAGDEAAAEAADPRQNINVRGEGRYRAMGRITSPDFQTWSELEIVLEADAAELAMALPTVGLRDDPRPNVDIYTSCAIKYDGAEASYLAFPSFYYHWGETDFPGALDVQLMTSRDGISWQRAPGRAPFIRRGLEGSGSASGVYCNPFLVPVSPDELAIFYAGTGRDHGHSFDSADEHYAHPTGIFRATLRTDGFVPVVARFDGGTLTTVPLHFAAAGASRLVLNADIAAGGWIQVELCAVDAAESRGSAALLGHSRAEAEPLVGNAVRHVVKWRGRGGDTVDKVLASNRPVVLRLYMRDSKLFSFQFEPA